MTDDNKRDDQKRNDDQDRKRLSDAELKDVAGGGEGSDGRECWDLNNDKCGDTRKGRANPSRDSQG